MTQGNYKLAGTKQFREIFQSCVQRNDIKPWIRTRTRKLPKSQSYSFSFWYLPQKIRNNVKVTNDQIRYVSFHFDYMDYKPNYEKFKATVEDCIVMCELMGLATDLKFTRPGYDTVVFTNICCLDE